MAANTTYPGVYVQEIPSGIRSVAGVSTSITAFVGVARRGPVEEPVTIHSQAEYDRTFGGLWYPSGMSYAVNHYFLNGGSQAVVVRVLPEEGATKGVVPLDTPGGNQLAVDAVIEGSWFENVYFTVDHDVDPNLPAPSLAFNLFIREYAQPLSVNPNALLLREETFRNIDIDSNSPRYCVTVLELESAIARFNESSLQSAADRPMEVVDVQGLPGDDGFLGSAGLVGTGFESAKRGIYALEKADHVNILCLPPLTRMANDIGWADVRDYVWPEAAAYAAKRRAILLIDPPIAWTKANAVNSLSFLGSPSANSALYFPYIRMADPLRGNAIGPFAPSGAVAGVIARTDAARGVWKAPAGLDARLIGVSGLAINLTEQENGELNPLGVNVLRATPAAGNIVWGARTRVGSDNPPSQWKYLPVRRTALYIEQSLEEGLQWVVFEPNGASLWAQIRLNVGAFMHELFRQGAFQGAVASEAYFVRCDATTTTQNDIDQGVVNIIVGFAPLKPAEFVVIKLQQIAGQIGV